MGEKLGKRAARLRRRRTGDRSSGIARIQARSFRGSALRQLCVLVCSAFVLLAGWQGLWQAEEAGAELAIASSNIASSTKASFPVSASAPATLGLEAPEGTEFLGREFLIVGPSDRRLDREAGERLDSFWPLRELITAFNRDFVAPETPLVFTVDQCPIPVSSIFSTPLRADSRFETLGQDSEVAEQVEASREQYLTLCYEQLQALDDYADDLSGSLTEQHLAVLDMVYFLLDRELSRLLVSVERDQGFEPPVNLKPLEVQTLSPWLAPEAWKALPEIAALDQLTAILPQRLRLQQQTAVLSGAQWLFNQGNPLLEREQLGRWTKDAFSLQAYQRLICAAEAANAEKFPFLNRELPREFALERCP